ncbi:hypothetical protein ILUMI_00945 [Ignelater luminosus]|uniref:Putative inositol monophosphatase 3 n=1 Tax=Ignelater luminosus TaxID=2038154 RepID=A0A8K0GMN2_IGNLU|nr:hypothetical protein ILUMI_00945 [Ignelater luminosus]
MNLGGTVHINKTGCCVLFGAVIILFVYMFSNKHVQTETITSNQINLRKLLSVAIKAAEYGGKEVVAIRNNLIIENKGKTKEGANDSVTTADFKSHCVMVNRLKHSFPSLTVISEESKTICDNDKYSDFNDSESLDKNLSDEWIDHKDIKVWIDPLDATQEYTEKLYKYVTTMVCVAVRGQPVIGVIHKPFDEETSWAWVGKGQSSNFKEPKESAKDGLKFIVSRSHPGAARNVIEEAFKGQKLDIIFAGGAGYKALELVNGNVDAYIHITAIKKWDICAGNAIINALGGRMTTRSNEEIDYSDLDNPVNGDGIIAALKNHKDYLKL